MAHGGRARGEMGGGAPESSVGAILFTNNWSDLAGDEGRRGGMGGGVGRWPMEGGQGGRWGGGTREQCGSNKRCTGSLFWAPLNPTTGLIWLVTRGGVGGWGKAWGGGPWRAGNGGDGGGAPESSVGATKGALVPFLGSLKNLTTGLIWLVTRVGGWGEAWGGGPWRAGKGEYLDVIPKWPEPQCSHHYACACCRVGSSGYTLSLA